MNPEQRGRFHELRTQLEEQLAEEEGCVLFEPGEIVSRALTAEQGA